MPQLRKYKRGGKAFPDLTGDGKVTRADILKGRGVFGRKKKEHGIGGAVFGGINALMQGKGLAGAVKQGVQGFMTPGSGISQGMKFAGNLAQKSNNPMLQKFGDVANMASSFAPGGGGLTNVLTQLPGMFQQQAAAGMKVGPKIKYASEGRLLTNDQTDGEVMRQEMMDQRTAEREMKNSGGLGRRALDVSRGVDMDRGISGLNDLGSTYSGPKYRMAELNEISRGIYGKDIDYDKLAASLDNASSKHKSALSNILANHTSANQGGQEGVRPVVSASFGSGGSVKMKYASNGTFINGDPTDPKKSTDSKRMTQQRLVDEVLVDDQGTPMINKVVDRVREEYVPGAGAEFTSNEGMQEGRGEGAIASYNKNSLLSGNLTDKEFDDVMNSSFGQEYLKGATKENIGQVYKENYLTKVNDLFNNSPEEALSRVNEMAKTNQNFATKLKGKSDEEKLRITEKMMTDGLIGDFHGSILDEYKETPLFTKIGIDKPEYGYDDFNIHGYKPGDVIHLGLGVDRIGTSARDLDNLLYASEQEGVDLTDEKQAAEFLPEYFKREGVNVVDAQLSANQAPQHYLQYMRASNQADFFSDDHVKERKQRYGHDPYSHFAAGWANVSAQEFQRQRDEANRQQDLKQKELDKEQYLEELRDRDERQFVDDYFKKRGIDHATATDRDYRMAEADFRRSEKSGGSSRMPVVRASFGRGGVTPYGYGGGVKMLRKK